MVKQSSNLFLSDTLAEEVVVKFVLERVCRITRTEGGSLFHSLTTSLVKNNLAQSCCTCLHLSFTPLLLVRDVSSTENSLLASTLVKPFSILKHSINLTSVPPLIERKQI